MRTLGTMIPKDVADGIAAAYRNFGNRERYPIRFTMADMLRLYAILSAVPEAKDLVIIVGQTLLAFDPAVMKEREKAAVTFDAENSTLEEVSKMRGTDNREVFTPSANLEPIRWAPKSEDKPNA